MRWFWLVAMLSSCDYVFRLDKVPDLPRSDAPLPVVGRWFDVVAGAAHTCAIDNEKYLWCWGSNSRGETGTAFTASVTTAAQVDPVAKWLQIATRDQTTCGIQEGQSLWCWGANWTGQVGDNSTTDRTLAVQIPGAWLQVATTNQHTCAIKSDHTLWCWGGNGAGQLGDGTTTTSLVPVQEDTNGTAWSSVAVGEGTTCALTMTGEMFCWGQNGNYQFSTASPSQSLIPIKAGSQMWKQIDAGAYFGCGITIEGRLRCWGHNGNGELGDTTTTGRMLPTPVAVPGDRTDWEQLVIGWRSACARTEDGRVFCWGQSTRGQIARFEDSVETPVEIVGSAGAWTRVAAGMHHTCVLAADETLWCVGADGSGQLGDGGTSSRTPVAVPGTWKSVNVGRSHTCAIDTTDVVSCTGDNAGGQLGLGSYRSRQDFTPTSLGNVTHLRAGQDHNCASSMGSVYCWGVNYRGQLGNMMTADRTSPTSIRPGLEVRANQHTCTLDGTSLWCWGDNEFGQVGNGSSGMGMFVTMPYNVTQQAFAELAVGRNHTCAIDTGGAVWCWGDGNKLGDGVPSGTPRGPVPNGMTGVSTIYAGGFHTCATLSNSTTQCWGGGYRGQLGNDDTAPQFSPVTLPGTWAQLAGGLEHMCGIQQDGGLYCWGDNLNGQLGILQPDERVLTPQRVGSELDWALVSTFQRHTCGLKTDGSMYCWGDNNDGQYGNGTAWRSTLVQAP